MHSFILTVPSENIQSEHEIQACINLILYEVADLLLKDDLKVFAKERGSLYFHHLKNKYFKNVKINRAEDQTIFSLNVPFDEETMVEPS